MSTQVRVPSSEFRAIGYMLGDDGTELQGSHRLAEGDAVGQCCVRGYGYFLQARDLQRNRPDPTGGSLDP